MRDRSVLAVKRRVLRRVRMGRAVRVPGAEGRSVSREAREELARVLRRVWRVGS